MPRSEVYHGAPRREVAPDGPVRQCHSPPFLCPVRVVRDETNLATNEANKTATMKIDEPETPWASPPRELLDDGVHLSLCPARRVTRLHAQAAVQTFRMAQGRTSTCHESLRG